MSEILNFIPTKGSLLGVNKNKDFKGVVHNSYVKKKKNSVTHLQKNINASKEQSIDLNKSRYEVLKFGMSGFDNQRKEEVKIQLAIKLGARPPKNKYKNYKLLKEDKKKENKMTEQKQNFQQLGKNKLGKSIAKGKGYDRKQKRIKESLLDKYGKPTILKK